MKEFIKNIPVIGALSRRINRALARQSNPFPGSTDYWKQRYASGGNSGAGSYDDLAGFKAEVLNGFVRENGVRTVIEYGCGDGNQLRLARYPSYTGFDISPEALSLCRQIFSGDDTKTFKLVDQYDGDRAQLTISLDVIYHLVEDEVFDRYMERLFGSSESFVIIYSSNTDDNYHSQAAHVRHRRFSEWIDRRQPQWRLLRHVPNKYRGPGDEGGGSFADFYIYAKSQGS